MTHTTEGRRTMNAMWRCSVIMVGTCAMALAATATAHAADAAATYKAKCLMCHGADGSGSVAGKKLGAKDLRAPNVTNASDAQLIETTTKGRNKMPAFDQKLTAQEIKNVVEYLRTLKQSTPINADER